MSKKVYMVVGHPSESSFNSRLADAYEMQLKKLGYEVKRDDLSKLKFDYNLRKKGNQELEPDLVKSRENISWADELVFFYPMWLGIMPAGLKAYFDRVYGAGFAFKYTEKGRIPLLKGKTGKVFSTCDAPKIIHFMLGNNMDFRIIKNYIMRFCGIKPKKFTRIDKLFKKSDEQKEKIIQKIIKSIK